MTLKEIGYDLLKIIRGSKISQSESISIRQIYYWVHNHRAVLLKQDIDKNKFINDSYIQWLRCLELEAVSIDECCIGIPATCTVLRTTVKLPSRLNLASYDGITFIGTVQGKRFQFMTKERTQWYKYKKFIHSDAYAYIENDYLYIANQKYIKYITVAGIFEDPTEIANFTDNCSGTACYTEDSDYPMPADKVPTLKEMILQKELGIMVKMPSDNKNDSESSVSPNIEP